jgi:hypothetical protein
VGWGGGPEVGEKRPGERRRQVARSWQNFSASGDQKKVQIIVWTYYLFFYYTQRKGSYEEERYIVFFSLRLSENKKWFSFHKK